MNGLKYYIVDVFAESKYAGNQLAVFRNVHSLTTDMMQKIAREINYSETTFILSETEQNGGYDVRIFTPKKELPFAGHPTLGTAYIIQQEIIQKPIDKVMLNLKVGQIPVTFSYKDKQANILFMRQLPPTFGKVPDTAEIAEALSISINDIDNRFPIQEVSTGVPNFVVPPDRSRRASACCGIPDSRSSRGSGRTDSNARAWGAHTSRTPRPRPRGSP